METCQGSERCVNKIHIFFIPGSGKNVEQAQGSDMVLYFLGDDVGSTSLGSNPDVRRMSDPAYVAEILSRIFPEASCVAIISPSRYEGAYACYDHFLEYDSWDLSGLHIKGRGSCGGRQWVYTSKTQKALHHLHSLLTNSPSMKGVVQECRSWVLAGFSKGGIVLNQILTEISSIYMESRQQKNDRDMIHFFQRLSEVHYLDVGLPCYGAYIWHGSVINGLANFFSTMEHRLTIHIHGTSRQFGIRNRDVARLIEELVAMIRLCVEHDVPVNVQMYNIDDNITQLLQSRSRDGDVLSIHTNLGDINQKNDMAEHCRILEYISDKEGCDKILN